MARSTAERVDRAMRNAAKMQEKYGFPKVHTLAMITDRWEQDYAMERNKVDQLRADLAIVESGLGKIPWR